ncbi:hypothetical protein EVG20_g6898 [Dentipellis fragilis]|uniref:Uncharacterized protein n=1 Tax=Dentipellis fragilis TaxID=205917 RepID=A0A4Y9YJ68_9AGAM|nr:hypothetical protein EVG20_g6898 [Dentipellis fragilis]
MHAELPVGAFLAAVAVLIPIPWHWRARNVPTLSIIAWLFVSNFIYGINTSIWAGNARILVPVWCDIVTKIQIGSNIALPAACFCLCVHLERIASVRQAHTTRTSKTRQMIFDLSMCWLLPILYMILHYIVQGHRFDIVEDFGCRPTVYVSIASLFIVFIPPLALTVATLILGGVALAHFFRRRLSFARHLQQSNSALTTARYFRLMVMALVEMFWTLVVSSLNVWFTCRGGLRPWISWDNVHVGFSQIGQFPTVLIPKDDLRWTFALWWTIPISAFIFSAFFAFGEDAMREYCACFAWVRLHVFRMQPPLNSTGSLPSYNAAIPPRFPNKTFSSMGSTLSIFSEEPKVIAFPLTSSPSTKEALPPFPQTSSSTSSLPPTPNKPLPATPVPSTPSDRLSFMSVAETHLATPPHTPLSQRPFSYPIILLAPAPPGRHRSRTSSVRLTVYSSSQVEMGEAV